MQYTIGWTFTFSHIHTNTQKQNCERRTRNILYKLVHIYVVVCIYMHTLYAFNHGRHVWRKIHSDIHTLLIRTDVPAITFFLLWNWILICKIFVFSFCVAADACPTPTESTTPDKKYYLPIEQTICSEYIHKHTKNLLNGLKWIWA